MHSYKVLHKTKIDFSWFVRLSCCIGFPGIFKGFWLAGGPGSGKSKVTGEITGSWVGDAAAAKDKKKQLRFVAGRTGPLGLKIINSDEILTKMLIDAGMHLRMDEYTAAEKEQKETIRDEAKKIMKARQKNYVLGRLWLVLDGTGMILKFYAQEM